jgi:hypothetical protein
MWLFCSAFEDLFSDFFLHHYHHGIRFLLELIEKIKEYWTRDIVGDIGDHGVGFVRGSKLEDIDVMESDSR